MASTETNSDLVMAGQVPPIDIDSKIEQISDDLIIQQTILASLFDVPLNSVTSQQITETEAEIGSLKKQLAEAHHARQHRGTYHPLLPWLHHLY